MSTNRAAVSSALQIADTADARAPPPAHGQEPGLETYCTPVMCARFASNLK